MAHMEAAHAQDAAASQEDQRSLFGLRDDTSSGNAWQGSQYTSSTRTFRKWWPAVYADHWKLPNGLKYPFIWKLDTVRVEGQTAYETWTWEWIETPEMPTIAQVEHMIREHKREQEERLRASAAAAADTSEAAAASSDPKPS